MKYIQLTQGQVAIVDDEDFERLNAFKWCAARAPSTGVFYAVRQTPRDADGNRKTIRMHREVLGATGGQRVDHIHGNTLDNRRSEIRFCTDSQNNCNRAKYVSVQSAFKGACRSGKKWMARIRINNRSTYLGSFNTQEEAARAYDAAAVVHHGVFARPNFPLNRAA